MRILFKDYSINPYSNVTLAPELFRELTREEIVTLRQEIRAREELYDPTHTMINDFIVDIIVIYIVIIIIKNLLKTK